MSKFIEVSNGILIKNGISFDVANIDPRDRGLNKDGWRDVVIGKGGRPNGEISFIIGRDRIVQCFDRHEITRS